MRPFDLTTGIELELLLPEGMGRLDLCELLGAHFSWTVEPFLFGSKVPVPSTSDPDLTIALIQDVARHHEAEVRSVSPDMRFFYLAHRAGRLLDADGRTRLQVVHDNTLAGGERVAEVITPPLLRDELWTLREVVEVIADVPGCAVPDGAALHVHLDGRPFTKRSSLLALVETYLAHEDQIGRLVGRSDAMKRAHPLPAGLLDDLRRRAAEAPDGDVVEIVRAHVSSREHGLNLFNLAAGDPNKLTVELKVAAATLDPDAVLAIRELYVELARAALESSPLTLPP